MASFTDTGNQIVTTDTTLNVLSSNFLAGTIVLGGNEGSGNSRMYSVIIVKYDSGGGCTDNDSDGWCIEDGDCNDNDPSVNPGSTEVCDGIDNNCDGVTDEGCGGCTDADGDGVCVEDGDCDDNNSAIYPGAEEICDGKDNNCDGTIDEGCNTGELTDADGDGYYYEIDDCDDNDAHIYPGHNDTNGRWGRDGVDNDCDGIIDG
jgi:hypothetical protein